ncbi:MAG: HesA/MoeB/ThiF family protein [Pseudomonadales bacterium]
MPSHESAILSDEELLRYSRQLLLEPFGFEAQTRFKEAHILVIGVGGLGCPAALYLAAAGIGKLTLADHDQLDLTNLQRQILYRTNQVGETKTLAAANNLTALNPHVDIKSLSQKLTAENLGQLIDDADLVLDCTDNLDTRYAVNAACVSQKTPLITAAAIGLEGHFTFFNPGLEDAPCYQCMVPDTGQRPDANCATNGVLGPVLGMMGSLQALTALKHLAGLDGQAHTLIRFDALNLGFQQFKLVRDPQCPICNRSLSADH